LDALQLALRRRTEFDGLGPDDLLDCLIQEPGERPFASAWVLAYREGLACGLVLPSLHDEGSIMGLGLTPAAAGSGLGRALPRHALDSLHSLGAKRYVDHIDADSKPMRSLRASHGCIVQCSLHQFRLGPP
jgi:ribosomal protein S18 acetylase RimI-like enzyme